MDRTTQKIGMEHVGTSAADRCTCGAVRRGLDQRQNAAYCGGNKITARRCYRRDYFGALVFVSLSAVGLEPNVRTKFTISQRCCSDSDFS